MENEKYVRYLLFAYLFKVGPYMIMSRAQICEIFLINNALSISTCCVEGASQLKLQ